MSGERFERIVSVGMFEHVGIGYFDEYVSTCRRLMTPDGVGLIHSIGRVDGAGATSPFIEKYVFPGGYIPALSEVLPAIERSGLVLTDIEILRLHDADTIRHWQARFQAAREAVVALKGERFARMGEFYLAGSEAAFRVGDMMVFQIQVARNQSAVPLTRDYIAAAECALAARDSGRPAGPSLVARQA